MAGDQGKTCIQLLRVAAQASDSLAVRLRVEQALAARELAPRNLPPSAILCVHRMHSPEAAIQRLVAGRGFSNAAALAWEDSMRDALSQLVTRAVRPVREFVPASADCILFNDRAEMLACLAMDWRAGAVGLRWWWRSLLPRLDGLLSVLAAWMEAPEYIPAAWQHLAKAGGAVQFAGQIRPEQARAMLKSVLQKFALSDLKNALDVATHHPLPRKRSELVFEKRQAALNDVEAGGLDRMDQNDFDVPVTPWQRWAAESADVSLLPDQQLLLGIALTLQRAPAVARTRNFALATQCWIEAVSHNESSPHSTKVNLSTESDSSLATVATMPLQFEPNAEPQTPTIAFVAEMSRPELIRDDEAPATDRRHDQRKAGDLPVAESQSSTGEFDEPLQTSEREPGTDAAPAIESREEDGTSKTGFPEFGEVAPLLDARITTGYGGLFYLLNFGLYLELYGDITTPSVRDIPLGIWDFLALLGKRLVGQELCRDPIWALLTRLAQREEMPDGDCLMPEQWRMPVAWLKPFDADGVWQWTTTADRLCVWHPARFVVLDVPLESGNPLEQLHREMEVYTAFSPRLFQVEFIAPPVNEANAEPNSVHRWLNWLTPYALLRLQRALGLTDTSEVGQALCQSRAQVFVTATHLDVVFSLAELRVEIRLAGLDRDPGWIPATGRIIRFHFEG